MAAVEVRRAELSDLERVMEVLGDGRAALGELGIDQWQQGYPSKDVVLRDIAGGNCWVAVPEDEGVVMATACITLDGEPIYDVIDGAWQTDSTSADPSYATVHRVAVSSQGARRGLARLLFGHAEKLALDAGYRSVRVDTHAGNIRMRTLLPSLGYSQCGVVMLADPKEPTRERTAYEKVVA